MSYILDALKKSESERQKDELPHLNSIHDRHPYKPEAYIAYPQKSWRKIIITSLLLVTVSSALWFVGNEYIPKESPPPAIPLTSSTNSGETAVEKVEKPLKPVLDTLKQLSPEQSTVLVPDTPR